MKRLITDVFFNQKTVNVCEHMVKTAPCESFGKVTPERVRDRNGWKIEWKSSEFNTRAVSRGHNKLIGKFKVAVGDAIGIRG